MEELADGDRCLSGGSVAVGGGGGRRGPLPIGRNMGRPAMNGLAAGTGNACRNMPAWCRASAAAAKGSRPPRKKNCCCCCCCCSSPAG
jgi:hypothetical protein